MDYPNISHVGIAVKDLATAVKQYSLITGENPEIITVAEQQVKVAIFKKGSALGGRVELLEPTSDDSPIAKFIERKGEGLHHICVYVDDIVFKMEQLKKAGVTLIDEKPKIGAEGNLIAFVHPKDNNGVLLELEELKK